MLTRLTLLREKMQQQNLDAMFISSLPNLIYLNEKAGQQLQDKGDAFMLITKKNQYFFTYRMYSDAVKNLLDTFQLVEIIKDHPLSDSLEKIVTKEKLQHIGYESTSLTVAEFSQITKNVSKKYFTPSNILSIIRLHKTSEEISKIKDSCAIGDIVFTSVLPKIVKGITERQLANEIDYAIGKENAGFSFATVIAFGANAAYPHHVAGMNKIKKGDAILMDFGVKKKSYCSDMTRTVFYGNPSQKSKKVYQAVYDAQQISIDYILKQLSKDKPIHPGTVDQVARDYLIKQNLPIFNHASHGIGLDFHELPYFSPVSPIMLEENMVFSIEPGCYLPDELGVRIEDLFTIQKGRLVQLTHAPKDLIVL